MIDHTTGKRICNQCFNQFLGGEDSFLKRGMTEFKVIDISNLWPEEKMGTRREVEI